MNDTMNSNTGLVFFNDNPVHNHEVLSNNDHDDAMKFNKKYNQTIEYADTNTNDNENPNPCTNMSATTFNHINSKSIISSSEIGINSENCNDQSSKESEISEVPKISDNIINNDPNHFHPTNIVDSPTNHIDNFNDCDNPNHTKSSYSEQNNLYSNNSSSDNQTQPILSDQNHTYDTNDKSTDSSQSFSSTSNNNIISNTCDRDEKNSKKIIDTTLNDHDNSKKKSTNDQSNVTNDENLTGKVVEKALLLGKQLLTSSSRKVGISVSVRGRAVASIGVMEQRGSAWKSSGTSKDNFKSVDDPKPTLSQTSKKVVGAVDEESFPDLLQSAEQAKIDAQKEKERIKKAKEARKEIQKNENIGRRVLGIQDMYDIGQNDNKITKKWADEGIDDEDDFEMFHQNRQNGSSQISKSGIGNLKKNNLMSLESSDFSNLDNNSVLSSGNSNQHHFGANSYLQSGINKNSNMMNSYQGSHNTDFINIQDTITNQNPYNNLLSTQHGNDTFFSSASQIKFALVSPSLITGFIGLGDSTVTPPPPSTACPYPQISFSEIDQDPNTCANQIFNNPKIIDNVDTEKRQNIWMNEPPIDSSTFFRSVNVQRSDDVESNYGDNHKKKFLTSQVEAGKKNEIDLNKSSGSCGHPLSSSLQYINDNDSGYIEKSNGREIRGLRNQDLRQEPDNKDRSTRRFRDFSDKRSRNIVNSSINYQSDAMNNRGKILCGNDDDISQKKRTILTDNNIYRITTVSDVMPLSYSNSENNNKISRMPMNINDNDENAFHYSRGLVNKSNKNENDIANFAPYYSSQSHHPCHSQQGSQSNYNEMYNNRIISESNKSVLGAENYDYNNRGLSEGVQTSSHQSLSFSSPNLASNTVPLEPFFQHVNNKSSNIVMANFDGNINFNEANDNESNKWESIKNISQKLKNIPENFNSKNKSLDYANDKRFGGENHVKQMENIENYINCIMDDKSNKIALNENYMQIHYDVNNTDRNVAINKNDSISRNNGMTAPIISRENKEGNELSNLMMMYCDNDTNNFMCKDNNNIIVKQILYNRPWNISSDNYSNSGKITPSIYEGMVVTVGHNGQSDVKDGHILSSTSQYHNENYLGSGTNYDSDGLSMAKKFGVSEFRQQQNYSINNASNMNSNNGFRENNKVMDKLYFNSMKRNRDRIKINDKGRNIVRAGSMNYRGKAECESGRTNFRDETQSNTNSNIDRTSYRSSSQQSSLTSNSWRIGNNQDKATKFDDFMPSSVNESTLAPKNFENIEENCNKSSKDKMVSYRIDKDKNQIHYHGRRDGRDFMSTQIEGTAHVNKNVNFDMHDSNSIHNKDEPLYGEEFSVKGKQNRYDMNVPLGVENVTNTWNKPSQSVMFNNNLSGSSMVRGTVNIKNTNSCNNEISNMSGNNKQHTGSEYNFKGTNAHNVMSSSPLLTSSHKSSPRNQQNFHTRSVNNYDNNRVIAERDSDESLINNGDDNNRRNYVKSVGGNAGYKYHQDFKGMRRGNNSNVRSNQNSNHNLAINSNSVARNSINGSLISNSGLKGKRMINNGTGVSNTSNNTLMSHNYKPGDIDSDLINSVRTVSLNDSETNKINNEIKGNRQGSGAEFNRDNMNINDSTKNSNLNYHMYGDNIIGNSGAMDLMPMHNVGGNRSNASDWHEAVDLSISRVSVNGGMNNDVRRRVMNEKDDDYDMIRRFSGNNKRDTNKIPSRGNIGDEVNQFDFSSSRNNRDYNYNDRAKEEFGKPRDCSNNRSCDESIRGVSNFSNPIRHSAGKDGVDNRSSNSNAIGRSENLENHERPKFRFIALMEKHIRERQLDEQHRFENDQKKYVGQQGDLSCGVRKNVVTIPSVNGGRSSGVPHDDLYMKSVKYMRT